MKGRIARIARSAVHDGPGVRTVVFFKGCPLRCRWCHSPETQSFDAEVLLRRDRCIGCATCVATCPNGAARMEDGGPVVDRQRCTTCGTCGTVCPTGAREIVGAWMTVEEVLDVIRRDIPFFDESGGGVTFSGGEPLLQSGYLAALLEDCHNEGIHTAVETCGYAPRAAALQALRHSPLFLYDLKIVDDARHCAATGTSNGRILANLRALASQNAEIIVRFPFVPGFTADDENVRGVAAAAWSAGVTRVDILPYHRAGVSKYERLDRIYPLDLVPAASTEDAERAAALMREFGIDAKVGGSS